MLAEQSTLVVTGHLVVQQALTVIRNGHKTHKYKQTHIQTSASFSTVHLSSVNRMRFMLITTIRFCKYFIQDSELFRATIAGSRVTSDFFRSFGPVYTIKAAPIGAVTIMDTTAVIKRTSAYCRIASTFEFRA